MKALRYDPQGWEDTYITERNNLLYLLSNFDFTIEQIGAGSVTNGRTNRNVDILIAADSIPEVSSIASKLETYGYKPLHYLSHHEISTLVKRTRVKGYGVTIRVVNKASIIHNRIKAFMLYLNENYGHIEKYNEFRLNLYLKYQKNWKLYYKHKMDYISMVLKENFKFER